MLLPRLSTPLPPNHKATHGHRTWASLSNFLRISVSNSWYYGSEMAFGSARMGRTSRRKPNTALLHKSPSENVTLKVKKAARNQRGKKTNSLLPESIAG